MKAVNLFRMSPVTGSDEVNGVGGGAPWWRTPRGLGSVFYGDDRFPLCGLSPCVGQADGTKGRPPLTQPDSNRQPRDFTPLGPEAKR
jgi:hypothetical protein